MEIYLQMYLQKMSHVVLMFATFCLLCIGFFKTNIINEFNDLTIDGIGFVMYFGIMVSLIYNVTRRDFYLPFLGHSVYPCDLLTLKEPLDASLTITAKNLTPNVNVIYWASEIIDPTKPDKVIDTPWDAYNKYANSGVTVTDESGSCVMKIRKPSQYKIPSGFKLKKHIHFRECIGNGMLGPVRTKYL